MNNELERVALDQAISGAIPDDLPGYRQRYTERAIDAILAAGFRLTPDTQVVTTGLYSDVDLATFNEWASNNEEWEDCYGGPVIERAVEFAVALANVFGPDSPKDPHVEVVSWFMQDSLENVELVPSGPISTVKIESLMATGNLS